MSDNGRTGRLCMRTVRKTKNEIVREYLASSEKLDQEI